jgi:hypothetical protein
VVDKPVSCMPCCRYDAQRQVGGLATLQVSKTMTLPDSGTELRCREGVQHACHRILHAPPWNMKAGGPETCAYWKQDSVQASLHVQAGVSCKVLLPLLSACQIDSCGAMCFSPVLHPEHSMTFIVCGTPLQGWVADYCYTTRNVLCCPQPGLTFQ